MRRYFLSAVIAGEKFEKEVTIEEYCKAERQAGFHPKVSIEDSRYLTTPATYGFSVGEHGISGSVRSVSE